MKKEVLEVDNVDEEWTILQLKEEITRLRGTTGKESLKLIYSGKVLSDSEVIGGLNIKGDVIMIIRKGCKRREKICLTNNESVKDIENYTEGEKIEEEKIESNEQDLTPEQIQGLQRVLLSNPEISQLITTNPQLREKLQDPTFLLEIFQRMNGTDPDEVISGRPRVVQVSRKEQSDLETVKTRVIEVVGPVKVTDGQLNGVIYHAYTTAEGDIDLATDLVLGEFLDGHLE